MNLSTDIQPISLLKSKAADMLKQINETHRPIIITQNGEAKAVLQDPESYEKVQKAIGLMKLISLSEQTTGQLKPQDQVFADLEKQLDA